MTVLLLLHVYLLLLAEAFLHPRDSRDVDQLVSVFSAFLASALALVRVQTRPRIVVNGVAWMLLAALEVVKLAKSVGDTSPGPVLSKDFPARLAFSGVAAVLAAVLANIEVVLALVSVLVFCVYKVYLQRSWSGKQSSAGSGRSGPNLSYKHATQSLPSQLLFSWLNSLLWTGNVPSVF